MSASIATRSAGYERKVSPEVEEGYTVLRPLGRGKFSQVSEVQHKGSSKRFAWKHVQREQNPLCEVEVELLRRMQHEHIIGIYDVYSSFGVLDIMLELCAGSGHI
ncbi:Serine/threonine-protein kinase H1 (Protein serine kinase H1) (PSK-H1) [Durusdinium trenchii]|uniref:Serine/threonine-protein kinase H1 (Protein serine kinase H1) (PSK-H1) n=1 Tax=Durusdinium trenchii TaxID=1381693 RepID=A0ABP0MZP5_9DINO